MMFDDQLIIKNHEKKNRSEVMKVKLKMKINKKKCVVRKKKSSVNIEKKCSVDKRKEKKPKWKTTTINLLLNTLRLNSR